MLDQLLGLIQENSQKAIVENPQVPNEKNNDVMTTIMSAITGGMQQQAASGNMQGIMGLLSGKEGQSASAGLMDNPIVSSIANNAIRSITEKFGLNSGAASGIVASVLPGVLQSLISKVSNPNDSSIDFNSILGGLAGGSSQAAPSTSGGFDFNQIGYALADGKLDMNDLINVGGSLMGGGNKTGKDQAGGLDLGGMLGGLFGK
ncbi:hypothetical protein [Dyadobacter tibetensis]|uniref:hypothetical protein n=1 Tax=Dyadobacter tibetensis TaxID=1211851 RepID=UPI00046FACB7|nr:hypothetical protein [Dyadobacter tibetensis]